MLETSRRTSRRAGSLVAALGVMLAMFVVASPAQAAANIDLTVDATTLTEGASTTLHWNSSEVVGNLVASGDWTGEKNNPSGDHAITPAVGTHTYTLSGVDANGAPVSDFVTVTVTAAAPGDPITPKPVTFPDPCTVVIPTTPNVTYFVDFGDNDVEELDAGTYDGTEFSFGNEVTFTAEANDGFTLANGAPAEWTYTAPDSCFEAGPEFVTTTVDCGSVEFTNTTDGPIEVIYGSFDNDDSDGDFILAAGDSRTIKTQHADFGFVAGPDLNDEEADVQVEEIEVPQNCDGGSGDGSGSGSGSGHPTTAPAAGIIR